MINLIIGFVSGFSAAIVILSIYMHHAEKITTEIESEPDHNTPDFTRRSGEGLENIKKYGYYPGF